MMLAEIHSYDESHSRISDCFFLYQYYNWIWQGLGESHKTIQSCCYSAKGSPQIANCVEIGLPMLVLLVVCQQYLQRIHHSAHYIVKRFALLFCFAIIWAFAAILTDSGAYNNARRQTQLSCRTNRSFLMSSALWIKILYPFQWGTPIFRASHVFGMIGAALISSAESTGAFYVASWLAGATLPPVDVLSRSIGLQGLGQLLEGIFGAVVGTTASV